MEPAAPVVLRDQLCFPLYAVSRLMTRTYAEQLAPEKLTYPQYLVLLVLWEEGEITVGELGERLRLDSGTITPLLKRLDGAGIVERSRDPQDERRVLVRLTDTGRALEARLAPVPDAVRAACGLSDDEIAALKGLLESLGDHLATHLDARWPADTPRHPGTHGAHRGHRGSATSNCTRATSAHTATIRARWCRCSGSAS